MSYNHEPQHDHDSGLSPHDTVPVATYNRMVRKRDEAVRERDQARQILADAPHADQCRTNANPYTAHLRPDSECNCWKKVLNGEKKG